MIYKKHDAPRQIDEQKSEVHAQRRINKVRGLFLFVKLFVHVKHFIQGQCVEPKYEYARENGSVAYIDEIVCEIQFVYNSAQRTCIT
jgi:hypothetical protein